MLCLVGVTHCLHAPQYGRLSRHPLPAKQSGICGKDPTQLCPIVLLTDPLFQWMPFITFVEILPHRRAVGYLTERTRSL